MQYGHAKLMIKKQLFMELSIYTHLYSHPPPQKLIDC